MQLDETSIVPKKKTPQVCFSRHIIYLRLPEHPMFVLFDENRRWFIDAQKSKNQEFSLKSLEKTTFTSKISEKPFYWL